MRNKINQIIALIILLAFTEYVFAADTVINGRSSSGPIDDGDYVATYDSSLNTGSSRTIEELKEHMNSGLDVSTVTNADRVDRATTVTNATNVTQYTFGEDAAYYYPDDESSDQGATDGTYLTVYEIAQAFGTSNTGVIVFQKGSLTGTTNYAFDTSLDLTSYPNLHFIFQPGALLTRTTGDETITLYRPENIIATNKQKITSADMIDFSLGGVDYPEWWGAVADGATVCTNPIQYAVNAHPTSGGLVQFNYGTYMTAKITAKNGITFQGLGNPITNTIAVQLGQSDIKQTELKMTNSTNQSIIEIPAGVQNVTIRQLRLDGNKTNQTTGEHCISIPGVAEPDLATYLQDTNIRIEYNAIQNAYSSGISLGIGYRAGYITNNWIMDNDGNGIAVTGGPDWTIKDNHIGDNGEYNIRITGGGKQRYINNEIWGAETYANILIETLSGYWVGDYVSRTISFIGGINDGANVQGVVINGDAYGIEIIGMIFDGNSAGGSGTASHIENNSTVENALTVIGCTFIDEQNPTDYPAYDINLPTSSNYVLGYGNLHYGHTSTGDTTGRPANYRLVMGDDFYIDYNGALIGKSSTITSDNDNLSAVGLRVLYVDTTSGSVVLGGLTGGVANQELTIVKTNSANNLTIENQEGVGDQDFVTNDGVDIVFAANGGAKVICDGTDWFVISE